VQPAIFGTVPRFLRMTNCWRSTGLHSRILKERVIKAQVMALPCAFTCAECLPYWREEQGQTGAKYGMKDDSASLRSVKL
jgi:hypothetical protein